MTLVSVSLLIFARARRRLELVAAPARDDDRRLRHGDHDDADDRGGRRSSARRQGRCRLGRPQHVPPGRARVRHRGDGCDPRRVAVGCACGRRRSERGIRRRAYRTRCTSARPSRFSAALVGALTIRAPRATFRPRRRSRRQRDGRAGAARRERSPCAPRRGRAQGVLGAELSRRDDCGDRARGRRVSEPVLYRHFASKRDLFLACLDEVWCRLREAVEEEIASEPDAAAWVLAVPRAMASLRRSGLAPTQLWLQALERGDGGRGDPPALPPPPARGARLRRRRPPASTGCRGRARRPRRRRGGVDRHRARPPAIGAGSIRRRASR